MTETAPKAPTLSAVLPVHAGVAADHLAASLESLIAQDRPADEIILVEDGPLTADLLAVLDRFTTRRPESRTIRLASNRGPGAARQAGLAAARSELVAFQDSDDISMPERFVRQLALFATGTVDVVGSAMAEFCGSPDNVVGLRSMPESQSQIARYARLRMPLNNPTVMLRRDLALAVGGFRPMLVNEDYDLVARLLVAGARIRNLPEVLVFFRAGDQMLRRRKATQARTAEIQLQQNLVRYGYISRRRAIGNLLVRLGFQRLPSAAMRVAYRLLFLTVADAWIARHAPMHSDDTLDAGQLP